MVIPRHRTEHPLLRQRLVFVNEDSISARGPFRPRSSFKPQIEVVRANLELANIFFECFGSGYEHSGSANPPKRSYQPSPMQFVGNTSKCTFHEQIQNFEAPQ